jgi:hypothetical protein
MTRIDHARELAAGNIARFQDLLASATDDFQREQLEGLLARELDRLESLPQAASSAILKSPGRLTAK